MAVAVGRSPRRVRVWWPAWFLLPPVALFAGFVVLPIVLAVLLSFCSWDGSSAIQFSGLANWLRKRRHDGSAGRSGIALGPNVSSRARASAAVSPSRAGPVATHRPFAASARTSIIPLDQET